MKARINHPLARSSPSRLFQSDLDWKGAPVFRGALFISGSSFPNARSFLARFHEEQARQILPKAGGHEEESDPGAFVEIVRPEGGLRADGADFSGDIETREKLG
jgi:hypothetical protein